ncbi:hypothetical protein [Roseicella aquatilis]|uniref:DUF1640 domain-containing protein n=1 Tax=Roseicella aquatilis TaxID=2527868 RepID=A0A4R4DSS0_9PROT|nr:hypothetical protein [Roseicella aquatilis]TCZ64425.1 hypothetical protein EXY23_07200 [Roseicella aquatilis]
MAATIDRMQFVRKLRGKLPGGWEDQHTGAVADALDEALQDAKLATTDDIDSAVKDLKLWVVASVGVLAAFLPAIKVFR